MSAPRPDLRSEELRASREELRLAGEEAKELAAGLTSGQLWWRPEPDRWSVGQCLEHLVLAGEAYLEVLDDAIEEGRRRELRTEGSYSPNLVGRWLPGVLDPPPGLKIPAPRRIRPRPPERKAPDAAGGDGAPLDDEAGPLPDFLALRNRFEERLAAADGLDLGRLRVPSPFVPLIRFDLGSAFRVIAAHERRHLWQARQVREAEDFPD